MVNRIYSIILAVAAAIVVQGQQQREPPQPYSYSYTNAHEYGGGSFHTSTGDANGRVTGSYGLNDIDGRQRVVDYVADELGFRATVSSNEPGVDASFGNPANVLLRASGARAVVGQPQPAGPVAQPPRRVVVRPQPVYQPVRPVPAVTRPTGSYRVVSVPRATGGYRVVEAPRQVEYVYARPSYVNYGPYY